MKCPVCESEVFEYHATCPVCDYFGLHKDFANDDEASVWERYVLKYYRALWVRKKQKPESAVDLESKEAIEIFQKYFSDDSHKYRLYIDGIQMDRQKIDDMHEMHLSSAKLYERLGDNSSVFSIPENIVDEAVHWKGNFTGIEINTKYLQFGFMSKQNLNPNTLFDYGHEYYGIEYLSNENVVSIFLVPKKEDGLKEYLCSILFSDNKQKNELITVLEFLKCGNSHFSKPFDNSNSCILECKNEELTYDTYFRHGPIKPLVFYAEVSDINENGEEMIQDHGLCKVTIGVRGSENKSAPRFESLFTGEEQYINYEDLVRILKSNEGLGYHRWRYLRENEHWYDYYLDRKQKIIFSGTHQEYRKYKFEDELLMQQVFNYMVILGTHWLM